MAGGGEEKTEKATPKKRRDERKQGHVPISKDVVAVAFILGAFISLRLLFSGIYANTSHFMETMIDATSNPTVTSIGNLRLIAHEFIMTAVRSIIPLLLICMALGIVATGVQTKWLFAKKALKPKFGNLSPLKGIKKLFSLKNVVEVLKGILKVFLMGLILILVIRGELASMARAMDMDVLLSMSYILREIFMMVVKVCLAFVFIAFFDFLFQRWEYERSIRMSKHDIKEEHKQAEGNPQIKGKIREIQRRRARERMMQAVQEADVIIRNPTHFAVALRYDMDRDNAPVVLAKGQDELAKRILNKGEEYGITIVENKALARAIYATTDLNQEIPSDYYSAVAEILVYVYRLNKKEGIS